MVGTQKLRDAGRYWSECDPDGFRAWTLEEGTRSLLRAGRYWLECDPDGFARLFAD